MSATALVGFLGCVQGLILASAIATTRREPRAANRALAAVLVVTSCTLALVLIDHASPLAPRRWVTLGEYAFALLLGPAVWHYAGAVFGRRPRVPAAVHLLPAMVWVAYIAAYTVGWVPAAWRWMPPILGLVAYQLAYTVAVGVRAWRRPGPVGSTAEHARVVRVIVAMLLVVHAAQLARWVLRDTPVLADVVPLSATAAVCVLSLLAFRQSRLFVGDEAVAQERYRASTLAPHRALEIRDRLLAVMERERLYRNERLRVADLATRLSVPRAHVSQVVNTMLAGDFRDLVNRFRVDEAKRLLVDRASVHMTIESIGYAVGFRSRSTFHAVFHAATGMTPAEARVRAEKPEHRDVAK